MTWYDALLAVVVVERLCELVVAARHSRWAFARGGMQYAQGHYPAMVALHIGLLVGCFVEPRVRDDDPPLLLALTAVAVVVAANVLRWWCIRTLGNLWNTRIVIVPGEPLVATGPYALMRHPNYVAVAAEGLALPIAGGAWITAAAFTVLNAVLLLAFRIPAEERALRSAGSSSGTSTGTAGSAA